MSLDFHQNHCVISIEGLPPGLLMSNPANSLFAKKTSRKVIPTPEESALLRCYWTEDQASLAFPAWNFVRGLVRASSGLKLPFNKKKALAPIIAGDVSASPTMIPFGTKKYDIDIRRVMVQRQGILRARPWLKTWGLTVDLYWESQFLGADFYETILVELLEILGKSIGIGDFRPECRGPFGRFRVLRIEKE